MSFSLWWKGRALDMSSRPITVVLADRNPESREDLRALLAEHQSITLAGVAMNGIQVMDMVRAASPDVVIMDFMLPEMDGLAVAEQLYYWDVRPKVVLLVTEAQESWISCAPKHSVDYCLLRPFQADVVAQRIRQLVGLQTPRDATLQTKGDHSIETSLARLMLDIGVPAHLKGHRYLREAIKMVVAEQHLMRNVTKILYPSIARNNTDTAIRVERAIRHAIEVAWNRGNVQVIHRLFGHTVDRDRGRPTNSEFIAMIADLLRTQQQVS